MECLFAQRHFMISMSALQFICGSISRINEVYMNPNRVEVTLRNTKKIDEQMTYTILSNDQHTSLRWMNLLATALNSENTYLEKNYHWVSFPQSERTLELMCAEINKNIEIINQYMEKIENPLLITERCYPNTVIIDGELNRDLMNRVHHYFELMQGRVWEANSTYFLDSNDDVRLAIRELNNLCHEIELHANGLYIYKRYPKDVSVSQLFSFFTTEKIDLNYYDFQNFTLDSSFGNVYMHYCQAGKTHWEAFQDNDDIIFDNNINGLRFMSGEFDIYWGVQRDDSYDFFKEHKTKYKDWLIEKGWHIADKTLGHGRLLIGKIDLSVFQDCIVAGQLDHELAQIKLSQYQDTYQIKVFLNNKLAGEQKFDFLCGTEQLDEIRKKILFGHYATYCKKTDETGLSINQDHNVDSSGTTSKTL